METQFPSPAAAAVVPAAAAQPLPGGPAVRWSRKRVYDAVNGLVYYGLLAFGLLFPVVATVYALIVY